MQYVKQYSKAKIVLNNADLHFLREMRSAMLGGEDDKLAALETRKKELDVINSVDAVLSYNETEHSVISSHTFDAEKIFKCPWVLQQKKQTTPFEKRSGIAFLGEYNHMPNRDAVLYCVKDVMPLLREQAPRVKFYVYGSAVPEEIEILAADDVIIVGYIESLDTLFDQHRVFVAPLLSGADIKGKVLESISYHVPCVLSPLAAEFTGLIDNLNARIASCSDEWVSAISSLYHDEAEWYRLSRKADELIDERNSFTHGLTLMRDMMSYLGLDTADSRSLLFKNRTVVPEFVECHMTILVWTDHE